MEYYSLRNKGHRVDFKSSVLHGLAPDGGLYFPVNIPIMDKDFIRDLPTLDDLEIALQVMSPFVYESIPQRKLIEILKESLNFPIPLVQLSDNIYSLELFHGPTLAFKDVGARFMSRCLSYFTKKNGQVIVLVATSGDTGSAVANGFLGVEGVEVVVLYPEGKVSKIQEKQFASLGQNIHPLAIDGTFDDCQKMVKAAFQDLDLKDQLNLSSANSINTARWLPQSIYYFLAYKQIAKERKNIVFSVPSGNLGNVTAGLIAWKMGLPIQHFIIAANANRTVPDYFETGKYTPRISVQTIANAMDVGAPSNFARLMALFADNYSDLKQSVSSVSYTDHEILDTVKECMESHHYLLDPHGATGFRSLSEYLKSDQAGIFLETAHPAKFGDSLTDLQINIEIPARLRHYLDREVSSEKISPSFDVFKNFLLTQFS